MNSDLEHRRLHELVDRLESRLNTVQVLAEVILDNAAMREGIPGPYLDDLREGALMDAMIHLCRSNQEDFQHVAKLAQLPLR
ncbi:hypothetical protein PSGK_04530 [Pseudomonas solani]|uniref:hypothetical protein n=1 Tax=Pseudomonas solani TaxID=2731552 RepID=UPI0016093B1A|nr:hypothetical protein [Pseudomonas alcaligenes]